MTQVSRWMQFHFEIETVSIPHAGGVAALTSRNCYGYGEMHVFFTA